MTQRQVNALPDKVVKKSKADKTSKKEIAQGALQERISTYES